MNPQRRIDQCAVFISAPCSQLVNESSTADTEVQC